MTNKWIISILLLIGYSIPFAFLAMIGDVLWWNMWFYLVMIIGFALLCFGAIKTKQYAMVFLGNIISCISSYLCIQQFQTEKWSWYFKPLTANMLMLVISVIVTLLQVMFVFQAYKKYRAK
ncbi:hypothetical protein RFF05_03925 [Bengtsoniella intestinalis]|uniref:hypothetical protein n=1 Tax=Bengtsoniella intestinalis TaxID=3073143 RepID=UPI00391F9BD0